MEFKGISQTQEDLMTIKKQSKKHKPNLQKKVGESLSITQSKINKSVSRKSFKTAKRS